MNICFTAHRGNNPSMGGYSLTSDKNKQIKFKIISILKNLIINENKIRFFLGGALTGDQLCFQACLIIKSLYPKKDIKIFLCIPCITMGDNWTADSYNELRREKLSADKIFYVDKIKEYMVKEPDVYYPIKMEMRNQFMIDLSNIVIGVYDGKSKGGTYNAIKYAKKRNRKLIVVNLSSI